MRAKPFTVAIAALLLGVCAAPATAQSSKDKSSQRQSSSASERAAKAAQARRTSASSASRQAQQRSNTPRRSATPTRAPEVERRTTVRRSNPDLNRRSTPSVTRRSSPTTTRGTNSRTPTSIFNRSTDSRTSIFNRNSGSDRTTGVQPRTGPVQPRTGPVTPRTGVVTPRTQPVQPRTGVVQPRTGPVEPRTGPVTPRTGPVTPRTGPVTPRTGPVEPRTGVVTPRTTPVTPRTTPVTPRTSVGDTDRTNTTRRATPSRPAPDIITDEGRRIPVTRAPEAESRRVQRTRSADTTDTRGDRAPGSRPGAVVPVGGAERKGVSPVGRVGDPLTPDRRDRINKRKDAMTRVPRELEESNRVYITRPGDRDKDHHDRDWDRHGCNKHDHSHCSHDWWRWSDAWGHSWKHRARYRYHWFTGPYYDFHGFGVRISFGGSWYYCPWYRTTTVVYRSVRYVDHVYYGVDHTDTGDAAVHALELGFEALEYGDWNTARRRFARAASLSPEWGLPRIGYALACAAGGNTQSASRLMAQAFERDPYSALEMPWSDALLDTVMQLEGFYTDRAFNGYNPSEDWFMLATMRLLLNDPDGAAEAAFEAEVAGNRSSAVQGLLDVLAGHQWQQAP
ncbi:MAG: hypothetical protein ACF8Q5_02355 [Phycisphaerales bacterium JB040]